MLDTTLFDEVMDCFEELLDPENIEETLLEMSQMTMTSDVLDATDALRMIMNYFGHPTCGDLARNLAMDWFKIKSPKMPALAFKRKMETEDVDSIPVKKIRMTEDEENISSVNAITEENEEEKCNSFTSQPFFIPNTIKEEIIEEVTVKPSSPPLTPSSSISSPSTIRPIPLKKTAEETRLEEISMRISKKRTETAAKFRKTVVLSEHAYSSHSRIPSGQRRLCK